MYEMYYKIDGVEYHKSLNAGSEDEAYYTLSSLYPTKDVEIIKAVKIGM